MGKFREVITPFIPPIGVSIAKWILHATDKSARGTPFKYLPNDISPKWIMDIGANEGYVAMSALSTFPKANLICFEPVSETYYKLKNNLSKFSNRTIILEQLAVSDFNGFCLINITNYNPANSINQQGLCYKGYNPTVKELKKEKVNVTTLDQYIQKLPANKIDIVKIDVEGLECEVIKGGLEFFRDHVDMIIIEISFQRDVDINKPSYIYIFDTLNSLGFNLINIYDVNNMTYDAPNIINDMMVTQIDCVFRKKRENHA